MLAIDCGSPEALRAEIDELVSDAYGAKIRLAIAVAAFDAGGLPLEIITRLLDAPPKRERIRAGSKVAAFLCGQRIDIDVLNGGKLLMKFPNGKRAEVDGDLDELPYARADTTAWLILSYFAAAPIAVLREGNANPEGWLAPSLLTTVGTCKYVLLRPAIEEPESILVHELPGDQAIVCHEEGLIEPITYALMQALSRDQSFRDGIIEMAKERNSLPLFSRINIALLFLEQQADEELAAWAANVRSTEIQQAFKNTMLDH